MISRKGDAGADCVNEPMVTNELKSSQIFQRKLLEKTLSHARLLWIMRRLLFAFSSMFSRRTKTELHNIPTTPERAFGILSRKLRTSLLTPLHFDST